jgi:hypothetical protein
MFGLGCPREYAPLQHGPKQAGPWTDPQHRTGRGGRSAAAVVKICWNRPCETMTSANWNLMARPQYPN